MFFFVQFFLACCMSDKLGQHPDIMWLKPWCIYKYIWYDMYQFKYIYRVYIYIYIIYIYIYHIYIYKVLMPCIVLKSWQVFVARCRWKVPLLFTDAFWKDKSKNHFQVLCNEASHQSGHWNKRWAEGACQGKNFDHIKLNACWLCNKIWMTHDIQYLSFVLTAQNHITCLEKGGKNKQSPPVKSLDDQVPKHVLWLPVPFDATPQLHSNGPSLPRHCLRFGRCGSPTSHDVLFSTRPSSLFKETCGIWHGVSQMPKNDVLEWMMFQSKELPAHK